VASEWGLLSADAARGVVRSTIVIKYDERVATEGCSAQTVSQFR